MATNQPHGLTDVRLLTRLVDISVTLNSTLELAPLLQFLLTTADRKSTRLNSSHLKLSRMPSSA